jgi:hypothetical protein
MCYFEIKMQFKEFDPEHATNLNCIAVIGKRSTGKTDLVRDILPHLKCSYHLVVGATIKYIENEETIQEYNEQIVADLLSKQKKALNTKREIGDVTQIPHACVVIDNYLHSNKSIVSLFQNGIFLKTKVVLAMQSLIALPTQIRSNIDYVFIFRGRNMSHDKCLYTSYALSIFQSFEEFSQALDNITSDPYTCMVINNTACSKKIEDNVMWYKGNLCGKIEKSTS